MALDTMKGSHSHSALAGVPKKTDGSADYRVCKAAMDSAATFEELARWGREEIRLAETEMPGLMALRRVRRKATFEGCENHRLSPYDNSNSRSD